MLDILSSPLRSYLAQTLQYYLSKYLKDIHLEGLGFFGSDLVLNDLEIKRHVLQTALDIPSTFDFSRGFIRELRIHIPWTQILSQPIEVKLYTVELILTAKDQNATKRSRRNSNGSEYSNMTTNTQTSKYVDQEQQIDTPKSGWLQSMLSKILANISIQINNLVLKYEQDDIVLSLTLGLLDVYSANEETEWSKSYEEPHGPHKCINKRVEARDISIFMDRYTSDRLSVDVDSDIIHRQVIGYEVPVLRRTSFGVRMKLALDPTPYVPSEPASYYSPSPYLDPLRGNVFVGPSAVVVDIFVHELNFSLSDRQVQMLVDVVAKSSSDQSTPEKPLPLARRHSSTNPPSNPIESHSELLDMKPESIPSTNATSVTTDNSNSWSSWAFGMIVGGEQDELEQELLQSLELTKNQVTSILDKSDAIPQAGQDPDTETTGLELSSQHLVTIRISIQHTSLTLRCHEEETPSTAMNQEDLVTVEYVPVANMGLVQVASHAKTKVSKAAMPILAMDIYGVLLAWSTNQTVRDLNVEIENFVAVEARSNIEIIRAGTFHQSGQCSIMHQNFQSSFYSEILTNPLTWNPHQRNIRHVFNGINKESMFVWQSVLDESDTASPQNCYCQSCSIDIASIESTWRDTIPAFVKFSIDNDVAYLQTTILQHGQENFQCHQSSLKNILDLVTKSAAKFDVAETPQANFDKHFILEMTALTSQLCGHTCQSRTSSSAFRFRLIEDMRAQFDISVGPIDFKMTTLTMSRGMEFSRRLKYDPVEQPTSLASTSNSIENQQDFLVDISHVAISFDEFGTYETAKMQVVQLLIQYKQQEAVENMMMQLDMAAISLNDMEIIQIDEINGCYSRSIECIDTEFNLKEISTAWSSAVGCTLFRLLLPSVQETFSQYSWELDHWDMKSTTNVANDVFKCIVVDVGVKATIQASDNQVQITSLAKIDDIRCQANEKNAFSIMKEGKPLVKTSMDVNIHQNGAGNMMLLEFLAILGIESKLNLGMGKKSIGGSVTFESTPFIVDWIKIVKLMELIPTSSAPRSLNNTHEMTEMLPYDWISEINTWSLNVQVAISQSKWKLSKYLTFLTPQLHLVNESTEETNMAQDSLVGYTALQLRLASWGLKFQEKPLLWLHEISGSICLNHRLLKQSMHQVDVDFAIVVTKFAVNIAPYHVALFTSIPFPPSSERNFDDNEDRNQLDNITWGVKGGLQLTEATCVFEFPNHEISITARDFSAAARIGNYFPLYVTQNSIDVLYVDTQLILQDLSVKEVMAEQDSCWLLNGLTSATILSIMMCLNSKDILSFAIATNMRHLPQQDAIENPLVLWQYASQISRHCSRLQRAPVSSIKLLICTRNSFGVVDCNNTFLTFFYRNHNLDESICGSLDGFDIVVSFPSIRALIQVVDRMMPLLPSTSKSSLNKTNQVTAKLPHVNIQTGPMRILLPCDTVVCMDNMHIDTSPHVEFQMDGLSCPPFTQLRKKGKIGWSTTDSSQQTLLIRLNSIYVLAGKWTESNQRLGELCSSYESSLFRITGITKILSDQMYIIPPFHLSADLCLTEMGVYDAAIRMTKVTVQVIHSQFVLLVPVIHDLISLPPEITETPEQIDDTSNATGFNLQLTFDGFDFSLMSDSMATIHLRVGSVLMNHTLKPTAHGDFKVKNLVVGFRPNEMEELIIFGPFHDPNEWQIGIEKYPETFLAMNWIVTNGILSGLIDIRGFQLHLSTGFLDAILYLVNHFNQDADEVKKPSLGPDRPLKMDQNVPVLGAIQQCKLKLLCGSSVCMYHSISSEASIALSIGSIFASVMSGYDEEEARVLKNLTRNGLNHFMTMKSIEYMSCIQELRVQLFDDVVPFKVYLYTKHERDDWHRIETIANEPQQVPFLQDTQIRLTGEAKHIAILLDDGLYSYSKGAQGETQIEISSLELALCFRSWKLIESLALELTNATSKRSNQRPVESTEHEEVSFPPSLNDFTDLNRCYDTRHHPLPGEIIFAGLKEYAHETTSPSSSMLPIAITEKDSIDMERLIRVVNQPWQSIPTCALTVRWSYHLPRRLCRILALPFPISILESNENWPKFDVNETTSRLCDLWCDLRCWDPSQNAYCTLGSFYLPLDRLSLQNESSFASTLRSWIEPNETELDRQMQWTFQPREYEPMLRSSKQWEINAHIPAILIEEISLDLVYDTLISSLRISSLIDPEDLLGQQLACTIPNIQLRLLRGSDVLHEVARVNVTELTVWTQNLTKVCIAGKFSGELQNMVTLSSLPVLPMVHLRVGCELNHLGTRINIHSSPIQLQLSQYALKSLLELPHLFSETPKDLSDMRILIRNGMGSSIYFRQVSTAEHRQLAPYESIVYSWQSITSPFQLQFAIATSSNWSTACDMNQPGVLYRDCEALGSFWIEISSESIQTIVTLRGSVVVHNYLSSILQIKMETVHDSNTCRPCTSVGNCSCSTVSFMARNQANLSIGANILEESMWSSSYPLIPGTQLLEPTTTENVAKQTFVSIQHDTNPIYMWMVVKRAISSVLQRGVVQKLDRYTWLEVAFWPVLQFHNSLSIPLTIHVSSKSSKSELSKSIESKELSVFDSYSPLQQHSIDIIDGRSRKNIFQLQVPRFVSVDNQDLSSYPSTTIEMNVPKYGLLSISRYSSTIPTRQIALFSIVQFRNDLPDAVVIQDTGIDGIPWQIPASECENLHFESFRIGIRAEHDITWSADHSSQAPVVEVKWSCKTDQRIYRAFLLSTPSMTGITRQVTVVPQYVVINTTNLRLMIKPSIQLDGAETVLDSQAIWWLWSNDVACKSFVHNKGGSLEWIRNRFSSENFGALSNPTIALRVNDSGFQWSLDISIAKHMSKRRILIPHQKNQHVMLTLHTAVENHTTKIYLSCDPQPPLIFENQINHSIGVALHDSPVMIGPGYTMHYDWGLQDNDDTVQTQSSQSIFDQPIQPERSTKFRLCDSESWSSTLWMAEGIQFAKWEHIALLVTIFRRAGTWVVRFKCIEGPWSNVNVATRNITQEHLRVDIAIDEMSVSLFDEHYVVATKYQEVFRLSIETISLGILSSTRLIPETSKQRDQLGYLDHLDGYTTYFFEIGSFKLMHLFPDCNFPVILCTSQEIISSKPSWSDSDILAKEFLTNNSISLRIIQANPSIQVSMVPYFHTVEIGLVPLVVQIEDTLVTKVLLWLAPLQSLLHTKDDAPVGKISRCVTLEPKIYMEHLIIQEFSINITARAIYGLDRTPLSLSAVSINRVFCAPDQLIKDLAANYVADALVHSPIVLMSLNCFGNPAGFFRDLGAGVQDFVRMPLLSMSEGGFTPYNLTSGVLRGTASFFTHASVAALTSVSGMATAVSKSMDHLSLARQQRHQMLPNTFASGLTGGLTSLGSSVVGAATGIVTTPLALYRDNQAQGRDTGFGAGILGIGKGIVGIVAQPVSGVASLVSMTSQGLLVELGYGPPMPKPLELDIVRNESLHVRWKILSDKSIAGDVHFATALYMDEGQAVVDSQWLLSRDKGSPACFVILAVSPVHVYVINKTTEEILQEIPLIHLSAMEQSVLEPTKLDFGIGLPTIKMRWHRFRLAPLDRRRLGSFVAQLKKW